MVSANYHMHERLTLIPPNEVMVFTLIQKPSAKTDFGALWQVRYSISPKFIGAESVGEIGELEMSCQRCGGVLGTELAASMYELVCGNGVIENRYCHCDDVQSPVQAYPLREGKGTLVEGVPESTISEGETPNRLWETRVRGR